MISFQRRVTYAGDPATAPLSSVTLAFRVPVYEYVPSTAEVVAPVTSRREAMAARGRVDVREAGAAPGRSSTIIRRETPATQSQSVDQPLTSTTYAIGLDDAAIAGSDDVARVRALQFHAQAMLDGHVEALVATVSVQYSTGTGVGLGSSSFDFISLPQLVLEPDSDVPTSNGSFAAYVAVNKDAYATLRQSLANTSVKGDDGLLLQALSAVTTEVAGAPTFRDEIAGEVEQWLERRTQGADASAVLQIIHKYFATLYDFPLEIPEVKALKIAGVITITANDGEAVLPQDFL